MVRATHSSIRLLNNHGTLKARHAVGIVRDSLANNVFFYNNSLSVGLRALTERLYYVKSKDGLVPCPKPTTTFTALNGFRNQVLKHVTSPPVWTYDEFVQSYTGSKKKRYSTAVLNLMSGGIKKHYGFWKTFIKGEFYDGTAKDDPCPRLIQPRSYEYNVLVGCFLRPIEKLIYKAIDKVFGHHVVLKCDNPWQRADTIKQHWDAIPDCCYVGFDASRFDQHISRQALEFEHSWYLRIYNNAKDLMTYLSWQIKNRGYANFTDGSLMYEVEGCRGSGDMNTALGNVIIMCSLSHHYLEGLKVPYRFIDDGDDCGVFISRDNLHLLSTLPDHHLQYGFEMTVEEPVFELEQVEFCQSKPIHCGNNNWMMVRNIHKILKQDALSITSRDFATYNEVMYATAVCGLALYEGLPVLDAYYRKFLSLDVRKHVVDRVLQDMYTGHRTWRSYASSSRDFTIDETEARFSIWKAFGILPDEQEILEDEVRAIRLQQLPSHKPTFTESSSRIQYYVN